MLQISRLSFLVDFKMTAVRKHNFLQWIILATLLGLTFTLWYLAQNQIRQKLLSEFDFHVQKTITNLEQHMSAYELTLQSVRALFDSSEKVDSEEFNSYVSSLRLSENYPGIQGISYATVVPHHLKAQHIKHMREQGFPEYSIHPSGERDIYTPLFT